MGFIGNIILAGLAGRHNRRANHVSRRLLGFVPENENLIVCGGNTGERGELATSIKEDAKNRIEEKLRSFIVERQKDCEERSKRIQTS